MTIEPTVITSRQNPVVVRAARLDLKKFRYAEGRFLIHGLKLTEEALRCGVGNRADFLARGRCRSALCRVRDAVAVWEWARNSAQRECFC